MESTAHYLTAEYLSPERFLSFGIQVREVIRFSPRCVLEIGAGPGVVRDVLRQIGIQVVTADIDARLEPDAVSDLRALPFGSQAFDVTLCCQVLEHMPFRHVLSALRELRRVSRLGSVISVPDITPFYYVDMALPRVRFSRRFPVPWARPEELAFDGEHYWSIGARGYGLGTFRAEIRRAGWEISAEDRPSAHAYHHFFVLR